MSFTQTIGTRDPWSMPSDGTNLVRIRPATKAWERRQYQRARRRESQQLIRAELQDHGEP
jgi:hypothetical protein